MVKGDKVRLNHELLLFAGFTFANGVWSYPDGETVDNGVPFFPESLDECFKHLVPTFDICTRVEFHMRPVGGEREYVAVLQVPLWNKQELDYQPILWCAKTPALAFCLAVKELINAKE